MNLESNANESATVSETGTEPNSNEKISFIEKVGYGLGDTASNFYWKFFEFFLMFFYTDVFGISAKSAGTMLLVSRIWDAVNDPLVGYLADRTKTSWGRFRPFLVWMCVPFAITGVLTFYTPDLSESGKLVYAYVTYTLVMMVYTAINIPYGALMGVISADSAERTSVSTYRFVLAFFGGLIVQYFTLDLVGFFGGTEKIIVDGEEKITVINQQAGYFYTMVVFSIAAMFLFIVTFLTTKERVEPVAALESTPRADLKFILTSIKLHQIALLGLGFLVALPIGINQNLLWVLGGYIALSIVMFIVRSVTMQRMSNTTNASTFEQDFNDLTSNRPWLILFAFGMFQLMGAFIRGGAILFYFKYFVGDESYAPAFWISGSIAAIVGMLLTRKLTDLFGKRLLMIMMNFGTALCTVAFIFLGPEQTKLMYAFNILGSFISGPSPVLLWAMYADVADYSEWKNHRRATGLVFSAATFSQKLGCALGSFMTGLFLDFYQYQPPTDGSEASQSDITLNGLKMMMSVIPATCLIVAAICLVFYNIDKQLMETIKVELEDRKNATPPS